MKLMKAAIYDPYLDTLGGGERYVMTVAQILKKRGWDVDVGWNDSKILNKLENRLGLNLKGINIVSSVNRGKGYDLCFWLSDGSIPVLYSKKVILHFQVPFHGTGSKLKNTLKFGFMNLVKQREVTLLCNSRFTEKFIKREYDNPCVVIYPPVDVDSFKSLKKENVILSVGRFSQLLQAKKQDILVKAFKKIVDGGIKGWKLVIVGGSDIGGKEYIRSLRLDARGYPIEIIENPDFNQLKTLYGKAKIFWSASGFGIDQNVEPEKVEHFGITVVEAMAAGCAPVVVNKGGHKEIVKDPIDGSLWDNTNQLISATIMLISHEGKLRVIAANATKKAEKFSVNRFENEIIKLVS